MTEAGHKRGDLLVAASLGDRFGPGADLQYSAVSFGCAVSFRCAVSFARTAGASWELP